METVVFVLMLLVSFNFMLKQTYRKRRSVWITATLCALFVGGVWPYAIEQSTTQIADWLADTRLMLDLSVVLTLEVALQMAYCMLAAHVLTASPIKPRTLRLYRLLRWFPGILIFPVLFYALVTLIFAFPGVEFPVIAWSGAAAVLLLIPAGAYGLRKLLPEKEVRLELLFLTSALIGVLGIIATVNGRTAVAGTNEVDWHALTGLLVIVGAGAVIGSLAYRLRLHRQTTKDKP